jgi:hypothetical protein
VLILPLISISAALPDMPERLFSIAGSFGKNGSSYAYKQKTGHQQYH